MKYSIVQKYFIDFGLRYCRYNRYRYRVIRTRKKTIINQFVDIIFCQSRAIHCVHRNCYIDSVIVISNRKIVRAT